MLFSTFSFGFLAVFFPFIGFLVSFIFCNQLGARGVSFLTTFFLFASFFSSCISFYNVLTYSPVSHFVLSSWIISGYFHCSWGFIFDSLSCLMLLMVTSISSLVHLYSIEYMSGDPHRSRFMIYLSMFTFFMLLLVTSDNLVQLFLGWEGIGLCSYLLIGFWFTRPAAPQSAFKAVLVNRVGDLGLMLSIALLISYFGTTDFSALRLMVSDFADVKLFFLGFVVYVPTLISLFLVLAAVGKSAQIGLHTWLPDAMEGPTPVSALIHAATLVTAGVFLLVRMSFLIEFSEVALSLVSFLGVMTAFLGATTGLFQYDIKRVIAYSTCSQLGYMFYACGGSNYDVAMFHLFNHAYFKALLFLGAGSVIHALSDEQDIRRMGSLFTRLPLTFMAMLVGTLSLCGFPFFSGYYSKDAIIETSFYSSSSLSTFVYWLGLLATFCSSFYSFRLLYLVFFGFFSGYRPIWSRVSEPAVQMSLPLFILSIPALFSGYFFNDLLIGVGSDFWFNAVFIAPDHFFRFEGEFSFFYFKLAALVASFFGAFFSVSLHRWVPSYLFLFNFSSPRFRNLFIFFNKRWCFDPLYNGYVVRYFFNFAYGLVLSCFDRGVLEKFGPGFSDVASRSLSSIFSKLQSGFIHHYMFFFVLGVFLFFIAVFFVEVFVVFLSAGSLIFSCYLAYLVDVKSVNRLDLLNYDWKIFLL